jgi:hypothetical protein
LFTCTARLFFANAGFLKSELLALPHKMCGPDWPGADRLDSGLSNNSNEGLGFVAKSPAETNEASPLPVMASGFIDSTGGFEHEVSPIGSSVQTNGSPHAKSPFARALKSKSKSKTKEKGPQQVTHTHSHIHIHTYTFAHIHIHTYTFTHTHSHHEH